MGNHIENIACWNQEINYPSYALNYFSREMVIWSKLNCLNSNYTLGKKVPLAKWDGENSPSPLHLNKNLIIRCLNQKHFISEHKKHASPNRPDVMNRGPKQPINLTQISTQTPKVPLWDHGVGALQVKRNLFNPFSRKRGQPTTTFSYRLLHSNTTLFAAHQCIRLENLHKVRAEKSDYIFKNVYLTILSEELIIKTLQLLINATLLPPITNSSKHNIVFKTKALITGIATTNHSPQKTDSRSTLLTHTLLNLTLIRVFQLTKNPFTIHSKYSLHSPNQPLRIKNLYKPSNFLIYGTLSPFLSLTHVNTQQIAISTRINDLNFTRVLNHMLSTSHLSDWPILTNIQIPSLANTIIQASFLPFDHFISKQNNMLLSPTYYTRLSNQFLIGSNQTSTPRHEIIKKISNFNSLNPRCIQASKTLCSFYTPAPLSELKIELRPIPNNTSKVILSRNLSTITSTLNMLGFCDGQRQPKPQFSLYRMPPKKILKQYKSVFNFITNPHHQRKNYRAACNHTNNILKISCIKLIAAKIKLPSAKAALEKYGSLLNIK